MPKKQKQPKQKPLPWFTFPAILVVTIGILLALIARNSSPTKVITTPSSEPGLRTQYQVTSGDKLQVNVDGQQVEVQIGTITDQTVEVSGNKFHTGDAINFRQGNKEYIIALIDDVQTGKAVISLLTPATFLYELFPETWKLHEDNGIFAYHDDGRKFTLVTIVDKIENGKALIRGQSCFLGGGSYLIYDIEEGWFSFGRIVAVHDNSVDVEVFDSRQPSSPAPACK